jgi:hypothetical protein
VIRTLGPMAPLRRPTVEGLDPAEIRLRLEIQKSNRSQARLPPPSSLPQLIPVKSAPSSESAGISGESNQHVAGMPSGGGSLTGSTGLESFDLRVLQCVRQLGGQPTRAKVFEAVRAAGILRPNHHQSLRRHVSFALTRLFRAKAVARTGSGGKSDPYRYSCFL